MAELAEIEKHVVARVKEKRLEHRLSQEKLSLLIGLSHSFVGHVESPNKNDKYNIKHLNALAKVFNCSPKDFLPDKPL